MPKVGTCTCAGGVVNNKLPRAFRPRKRPTQDMSACTHDTHMHSHTCTHRESVGGGGCTRLGHKSCFHLVGKFTLGEQPPQVEAFVPVMVA